MFANSRSARGRGGCFAGIASLDLIYMVDNLPQRNEKLSVPSQLVLAGGPATNAAITYSVLGGRCSLVTAVGTNPLGSIIRQELERFSVCLFDVAGTRDDSPPVSSILVVRNTGERTVVSANAGAFTQLQIDFDPVWLDSALFVLIDGHYMPLCMHIAQKARAQAIPVVLDGGSWKRDMEELLNCVDVVVCSNDFRPPGCRDETDVFDFLKTHGIGQLAITRGFEPILYSDGGIRGKIEVEQVRAVDTLGAGDIFHGAFCYGTYVSGRPFTEALGFAARIATFSCLHSGTRRWIQEFPQGLRH